MWFEATEIYPNVNHIVRLLSLSAEEQDWNTVNYCDKGICCTGGENFSIYGSLPKAKRAAH